MDISDLIALDSLWAKTHSYVVAQIMEGYQRDTGQVLELGPFAGGIALELARLYPELEITIADESSEVVSYLKKKVSDSGVTQAIAVKKTDLNLLAFSDNQFDLVIFRGAVFFLGKKESLLREIFRVLKAGGMAFVGGGHGKGVPQEIVSQIAGELRKLHRKLGGKWLSVREVEEIVRSSQLADNCQIIEEGGVWLNIRK
jgi:ubiquinone/menaquinone biosynthesis C-methylase UbiE